VKRKSFEVAVPVAPKLTGSSSINYGDLGTEKETEGRMANIFRDTKTFYDDPQVTRPSKKIPFSPVHHGRINSMLAVRVGGVIS